MNDTSFDARRYPVEEEDIGSENIPSLLAIVLAVEALMLVGLLVLSMVVYLANPAEIKTELSFLGKSFMRRWLTTGNIIIFCIVGATLILARVYYLQHRRK